MDPLQRSSLSPDPPPSRRPEGRSGRALLRARSLLRGLGAAGLAILVIMSACTGGEPAAPRDHAARGERQDGQRPDPRPSHDRPGRLPTNGVSPGPGGKRDEPVALDGAMEGAVLHPDGTITAWGYLVCTPGETMNVGWAIKRVRGDRYEGIVRTGHDRLYYECTGERQEWRLRGFQLAGGGIDPGVHPYTVKTAVGTGSRYDHRDYFQGTIRVVPA